MYLGDRSRKSTLVEHGFRLPSALDNRPLSGEEFAEDHRADALRFRHARAFDIESPASWPSRSSVRRGCSIRRWSMRPTEGQVEDLIGEILAVEAGEARARHHADQAALGGSHHLPARVAGAGGVSALRHRCDRARGDPAPSAQGEVRRAGRHQPAARGLDLPEVALVAVLDADKEG
jgi:excinuclease ABC subunit B